MNIPVKLRYATLEDQSFVDRLTRACMKDYVMQTWPRWHEQEAYFAKNAFDLQTTKIIQLGDRDIGRMSLVEHTDHTVLDNIHIRPEFQGLGIGRTLIESVVKRAHARGAHVKLQVLRVNPARLLYERLGFEVYAEDEQRLHMSTQKKSEQFNSEIIYAYIEPKTMPK